MGENEKFLVLPTPPPYLPSIKAVCDEMREELMRELGGKPHKVLYELPNCKVSYKDGMIVCDEFTKLPIGGVAPQNDGAKPLSEETAQQISKAFEDIRKTMEKDFPMAFAKRKARKHYKPKFTL